jgi:diaminopimelate decarboxylase
MSKGQKGKTTHPDIHKKEGGSVKAPCPRRVAQGLSRGHAFLIRALKTVEKRGLSEAVLQQYVKSFLDMRDLYLESAVRFGTPQYFFDEPSLVFRIKQFNEAFSRYLDRHRAFYALKSNSYPGIYRRVVAEGMGLDVSSGRELDMALATNCEAIIFSGPGKTDEELSLAVQNRTRVTLLIDNYSELQRVSKILKRNVGDDHKLKAGIRVLIEGQWDKFGIPLEDMHFMLKKSRAVNGIEICGLQFHNSWNFDPTRQIRMINEIGNHFRRDMLHDWIEPLSFLDIGGGFWPERGKWLDPKNTFIKKLIKKIYPAVKFKQKHRCREARTLDYFAREISMALSQQGQPLNDLELWTEPGRWISTPAMHILLRVVDKKNSRTVITDGGTNLLGWNRSSYEYVPVINLTRPSAREFAMNVFGSLCTPADSWGTSVFGDKIERGDILLVPEQGAYTYSMRQSFIKPIARVIKNDGKSLEEAEKEALYSF